MNVTGSQSHDSAIGISVVIPCLNEAETIARAVQSGLEGIARAGFSGEVIVADNGSTDQSREIATRAGARVISVPRRGYGAALHEGIGEAKFSWVVFGDADLSYPFDEVGNLVAPLAHSKADFVLGSRLGGKIEPGAMPFLNRHLGTPVLSFLIRSLYGLPTSDCNSGMRAFRREKYPLLKLNCPGMEYASEMLVRVAQRGLSYQEVPISFRRDQRTRRPHLRRWQDGWRHLRFILGNAPSASVILVPALLGISLLAFALALSFSPLWAPDKPIRFHSAFIAIAASIPFIFFAMSSLLVKAALHESGQLSSRLMVGVRDFMDNGKPFYISIGIYGLAILQGALILLEWYRQNWGELSDLGGVIRLTVFAISAAALFSLDLGIGVLRLLPFQVGRDR